MIINTNSKFFRFLESLSRINRRRPPDNVCQLFWFVVEGLARCVLSFVVVAMILSIFVCIIVAIIAGVFQAGWVINNIPLVLVTLIWSVGFGLFVIDYYRSTDHYMRATYKENEDNDSVSNGTLKLVKEFVQAKKQLICPKIEYTV